MHASVKREHRQKAEAKGVVQVPRHRGGRPRRAVADDEPHHQDDPEYDRMNMDDAETMKGVGDVEEDVDDGQQQPRRRAKRVPEPDLEPLDDYPGGPHNTTLLTRYHVRVARKVFEGEVPINVIL